MVIVFLLAAVQALFLMSLLVAKENRSVADAVLLVWLAAIGAHTLIYFLHFQFGLSVPLLLNLNAAFPLLQGPFLLGYVAATVGMRDRIQAVDYLHLLPFVAFLVFIAVSHGIQTFSLGQPESLVTMDIASVSVLLTIAMFVAVPAYILWSLALIRRADRALEPGNIPREFNWTRLFIVGLGFVWLFWLVSFFVGREQGAPGHLVFWALTLFVYAMGYLGLTRTSVFSPSEMEVLKQTLQPKYQKSGLSPADAEKIYRRIVSYVEDEKLYTDGSLSLQELASALDMSANHASQAINEFEQQNFRDFLNSRRIDEACRRLRNQPEINLLALAMDVGFNSKSSFNRAFRKFTGSTPSEFAASD